MKNKYVVIAGLILLLSGCSSRGNYVELPYKGPLAEPQKVYRIDDHRFFEMVPRNKSACEDARIYYTDTEKGIHVNIMRWDAASHQKRPFMIDAANDQYLIAPNLQSSMNCSAGGGDSCSDILYFSQDGGKTWLAGSGISSYHPNYLTGTTVYNYEPKHDNSGYEAQVNVPIPSSTKSIIEAGGAVKRVSLLKWKDIESAIPVPRKAPLDSIIYCDPTLDAKK